EDFLKGTKFEVSDLTPLLRFSALSLGLATDVLLSKLFQDDMHDLAVPSTSQKGGLEPPHRTNFKNIIHVGSNDHPDIIKRVVELTGANPKSSDFSSSGVKPPIEGLKAPSIPLLGQLRIAADTLVTSN